jgi:hypothetical protein
MSKREGTDKAFNQWMEQVDGLLGHHFGLSVHDIADQNYRDAFESGLSPEEYCSDELFPELEDEL